MDSNYILDNSEELQLLSRFGRILSHISRVNILVLLFQNDNKVSKNYLISYVPKHLDKHIEDLQNMGLIYEFEADNEIHYSVDMELYGQFKETFEKFLIDGVRKLQNAKVNMITQNDIIISTNEVITPSSTSFTNKIANNAKKIEEQSFDKNIHDSDLLSFIKKD